MTKSVVVQSVEPANLAGGDVTASLGHEADASLRVRGLEGVDVVDEGRLGRDLEVSDDAVSLAAQVDQVRVWVVDGEHDPVGGVQLHHDDGVVQVSGGSQAVLSLTVLGETCREDEAVLQVDGLGSLAALVGDGLLLHITVPGVHSPDLPVLAGEEDLAAVPVPAGGEDEVGESEVQETLAGPDVPDADFVVAAGREKDVLGGGMPEDDADPPLVVDEVHHALRHGPGDAAVRNLPDLHCAVLRGGG